MASIKYKIFGISVVEDWFSGRRQDCDCDVIRYFFASEPDGITRSVSTLVVSLEPAVDEIYASFQKKCRYDISRTIRDGDAIYEQFSGDSITRQVLNELENAYNAASSKIAMGSLNTRRINALHNNGELIITRSGLQNDSALWIYHVYILDNGRARLLYSVSPRHAQSITIKSMLGRINRWHHFQDMLLLKERGFNSYDLGGITQDDSDLKKTNIRRFKEEFRGRLVNEFSGIIGVTKKGRLLVRLLSLFYRF